ncbi:L,D-transpeptidase family protein [Sphingomonas sp.]|uniref:L,D-transpeptidase family protein n=1 Tax=Sphingomonas sp. TaxID=28214 RepID=UPI002DE925B8|nr:L,D-transpeptidase family protein [Sphingomonas sp.]HEV2568374.1 L,D-transpeptidase family protein [Sphingomonas sp.]
MQKILMLLGVGSVSAMAAALSAQPARQAPPAETNQAVTSDPGIDRTIMHVQVILDRLGFSPGVIDGKEGESLKLALRGFQQARGLQVTGKIDQPTLRTLHQYRAIRPTTLVRISQIDLAGPFTNPIPKDPEQQAKLPCLCYRTALEKIAERFHTTPATLLALNSPDTPLRAGQPIVVPSALPYTRDYKVKDEKARELLSALNVNAEQPQGDRVVVDKSDGVLRVFNGERLIAQFPATMGSERDPLPLGEWKITAHSYMPPWHYQPAILKKADKSDPELMIKPGPNNPVGVAWLDLSKEHYGIHGTADPNTIGRAESNGCIRLTNWDVARLSLMVKPGTRATFQE